MKNILLIIFIAITFSGYSQTNCPDEIINGNFKGNLGAWDLDMDHWVYDNGGARHILEDGSCISQHGLLINGNPYYVRASLSGSIDSVTIKLGGNGTAKTYSSNAGNILFEGVWNGNYKIAFYPSPNSDVRIDNVSVRAVNCQ